MEVRPHRIIKRKNLIIINDSKSTSFSSSFGILKANSNIFWLISKNNKKGDKFYLPKKYYANINAFIFGKNTKFFEKKLKGKIEYEKFTNLNNALKKVFMLIKKIN